MYINTYIHVQYNYSLISFSEGEDQELYDDITGINIAPPPPLSTRPSIPPPSPHRQNG